MLRVPCPRPHFSFSRAPASVPLRRVVLSSHGLRYRGLRTFWSRLTRRRWNRRDWMVRDDECSVRLSWTSESLAFNLRIGFWFYTQRMYTVYTIFYHLLFEFRSMGSSKAFWLLILNLEGFFVHLISSPILYTTWTGNRFRIQMTRNSNLDSSVKLKSKAKASRFTPESSFEGFIFASYSVRNKILKHEKLLQGGN